MTNIKPNKEVIVEAMIEIPKGSSNKYEFDHEKKRNKIRQVFIFTDVLPC